MEAEKFKNNSLEINLDSDLGILRRKIREERDVKKIEKDKASGCVLGLLNHLDINLGKSLHFVPRRMKKVGELYSLSEYEILKGSRYHKKTWRKLNTLLTRYGLPPIILPQEYTVD